MAATDTTLAIADRDSLDRTAWHTLTGDSVAGALGVELAQGLSDAEAQKRLEQHGPNKFATGKTESPVRAFIRQYQDLMQIVLLVAGIGSLYPLKEYGTGLLLIALTILNAVLGLQQEGKAAAAVSALQKMMIVKARVRRGAKLTQVPAEELVPGDVVLVEAGDVVPADGRLIQVATLEVDESALTGESVPVSKVVESIAEAETALGDRTDMVFMNTNVTRGTAEFVVTATGMATQVGHISRMLQSEGETETPLTKQLKKLTSQILVLAGFALVVSVVLNLSRGHSFTTVFTAAIAFSVAAIPTGLPAVVTAILSYGTQLLAQANAIVKRLRSAETLGCTSAINSDKTGTLTLNQMTAVEMTLPGRRYTISGSGYSIDGKIKRVAGAPDTPLDDFLQPMVLASDAVVDNGSLIGDPTEGALVVLAEKGGIDAVSTREAMPRLAELPFDAAYKLMATFHEMTGPDGGHFIRAFVKGAPDQLLARSTNFLDVDMHPVELTDEHRARYMEENDRLAKQGLRVMATARKDLDPVEFAPQANLLKAIDGLTVLTLVGIVDPARPEAAEAIRLAKSAGIKVRMITGDHAVTAEAIAQNLGIEGRAITGAEWGALTDAEALEQIDDIGVIARVTPEHKVRLVKTLQSRGEVVAMTGDGVNDAPALKTADIGIAMGITGTEVSKEAAVMILTDDNFATIVKAVELGRGLYDNLTKYIRFQMGALGGMIVTFLGASIFNIVGGVPFVPLQTLWVNFTTQVFQSIGLGYGRPSDDLMERKPRGVEEPILDRELIYWLTLVSLLHGAVVLGVIEWASSEHGDTIARTMGVTTFALMNLFYSFTCRSELRSVFSLDTFEDRRFVYASLASLAAIVVGAQSGILNRFLDTQPLDWGEWLICICSAASVVVLAELRKLWLRRRG